MGSNGVRRRRDRLAAARGLAPLQQGELDGFCGVYAIANALRLVLATARPLKPAEVAALFRYGVNTVEAK